MIDYEDDETELIPGGDRIWCRRKLNSEAWHSYYERHRERIIARNRAYLEAHHEQHLLWKKRYDDRHREKIDAYARAYKQKRKQAI